MRITRQNMPIVFCYLSMAVLFILTMNNGFFWDTLQLGSEHANYYFTTNFANILLPESIDSGHIPAFGMYLALTWKIFGRSLVVSHMAMLPFICGILWQLQKLTAKLISKEYAGWAVLLVFSDPTLLSQLTLVSPDVPLVFLFFLGLNSIMGNNIKTLSLSIFLLFLTSMRGMMVAFCMLIIDIIRNITFSKSIKETSVSLLRRSLIYLPAFILFVSYSTYHFIQKGWIGFHATSPWAELFEPVRFTGVLYNIGIIGWRILDFGRIGIWIVFMVLLIRYKKSIFKKKDTRLLFFLFLILSVFLSANMVWAKNLLCHRYLLPVYLSFSLLCASILFSLQTGKILRTVLISFWLVSVITGNLWVYPEKIAVGWDATLAHLPYYKVRKQALEYLESQNIDYSNVQSFFPNISSIDDFELNNDHRQFIDFNNSCDYVIYSNVFNVSDKDYDLVKNQYSVIKHFKRGLVYIDICKKNSF